MDVDYEDLSHDEELIWRLKQFHEATLKFEEKLDLINDPDIYDKLSNSDKIKYNLLMSYSLNSMFWMYLRTKGIDPSKHQIKNENDRLKRSMLRAKQIEDKKTLMPRINKNAAQRFIRNSLWESKVNDKDNNTLIQTTVGNSSNL
ncbi:PREDICTED: nuclear nucleic acid-binding protein C1D-like [Polistes canadensis]|uniref:nuclear nucleic acid-binding protein C1D-like n=1 Tax=Polistes canadensis TaxID=91411 RepID=UPI000718CAEC|nr:PREDICTED: nuclear nucleic acid-binding protein C1D-like [Polistes canadensis]